METNTTVVQGTTTLDPDYLKEELRKRIQEIEIEFSALGRKSSEGDGRTAADIEKELEQNGS